MTDWKCGECSSVEGEKKILVKKIPNRLFYFWSWLEKKLPFELPELPENLLWKIEAKDGEVNVIAMCHHCGKPLCQQHRILIRDNAFSVDEEEIKSLLPTWWPQSVELKANKQFGILESKVLSWLANSHPEHNQFKQKAYHCKVCLQKYHALADYEND